MKRRAKLAVADAAFNSCGTGLPVDVQELVELSYRNLICRAVGDPVETMPGAQAAKLFALLDDVLYFLNRLRLIQIFRAVFEVACPIGSRCRRVAHQRPHQGRHETACREGQRLFQEGSFIHTRISMVRRMRARNEGPFSDEDCPCPCAQFYALATRMVSSVGWLAGYAGVG